MKTALTLSDVNCIKECRTEILPFLVEHIDIIVGNEAEVMCLYNCSFDDALPQVQDHFEIAALTKGGKGSILVANGEIFKVDRTPVSDVVDTTGAGDIYASGFFYGLLQNVDFPTVGKYASATASEIIKHMGSRPEQSLLKVIK